MEIQSYYNDIQVNMTIYAFTLWYFNKNGEGDHICIENDSKDKECDKMQISKKPTPSTMIIKRMTESFATKINYFKADGRYWKECAASKKGISQSSMEQIKKYVLVMIRNDKVQICVT